MCKKDLKNGDFYNMKVKENRWNISDVFEVRISVDVWRRIKAAAEINGKTYTWITRYCLFQLIYKSDWRWTDQMELIHLDLKEQNVVEIHRHMLCLYGDDALNLRCAAAQLGLTINQLVRISIALYLIRVEKGIATKTDLFWYGIKLCKKLTYINRPLNLKQFSLDIRREILNFSKGDYWGLPDECPTFLEDRGSRLMEFME